MKKQMFTTYALESRGYFLGEQLSQLYKKYYRRVALLKNMLGVKIYLQILALSSLGKRGA